MHLRHHLAPVEQGNVDKIATIYQEFHLLGKSRKIFAGTELLAQRLGAGPTHFGLNVFASLRKRLSRQNNNVSGSEIGEGHNKRTDIGRMRAWNGHANQSEWAQNKWEKPKFCAQKKPRRVRRGSSYSKPSPRL